jgi:hypothetical protein
MSFPHLGGVLKLGFTSSFVPISDMILDQDSVKMILVDRYDHRIYFCGGNNTDKK